MPLMSGGPAYPQAAQTPRRWQLAASAVLAACLVLAECADAQRAAGQGVGSAESVAIAAPSVGQVLFIPSAGALCPQLRPNEIAWA